MLQQYHIRSHAPLLFLRAKPEQFGCEGHGAPDTFNAGFARNPEVRGQKSEVSSALTSDLRPLTSSPHNPESSLRIFLFLGKSAGIRH